MNLYEILFEHSSPKDQRFGIMCHLVASNDEAVYEWIKSEPETKDDQIFNSWADKESDDKEYNIYDKGYNVIGKESFKERMIRLGGEMNDENDYSDAYYGLIFYGWSMINENISDDLFEVIKASGIDIYKTE